MSELVKKIALKKLMLKKASVFAGVKNQDYLTFVDGEGKICDSASQADEVIIKCGDKNVIITKDIVKHIHENHKGVGFGSVFLSDNVPWSEVFKGIHEKFSGPGMLKLTLGEDIGYDLVMPKDKFESKYGKDNPEVKSVLGEKTERGVAHKVTFKLVPDSLSQMPKTKEMIIILRPAAKEFIDPGLKFETKEHPRFDYANRTQGKQVGDRMNDTNIMHALKKDEGYAEHADPQTGQIVVTNCFSAVGTWPGGPAPSIVEWEDNWYVIVPKEGHTRVLSKFEAAESPASTKQAALARLARNNPEAYKKILDYLK